MYKNLILWLFVALLASCNLRENSLLPPNLNPKDYVESSTIGVYSDHLIKSENDNSYLYIPKESISDSALIFGDKIIFRRSNSLLERDSLAFATDAQAYTDTYQIDVIRSGESILLDSIPSFGTIYTKLKSTVDLAKASITQSARRLSSAPATVNPYGSGRCFFDVDGNGDLALMDMGGSDILELAATGKGTQALLSRPGGDIYIWFPAEYTSLPANVSVADNLSEADLKLTQTVFPGFALNSPVISVQSSYSGSAVPIVHISGGGKGSFATQWTRVSGGVVRGWPSAADTWLYSPDKLISFLQGEGRYFLLTPVESQTQVTVPLDGSYSQLYLQDLWLDLKHISEVGVSLTIDLQPPVQSLINSYFSGTPFQIGSSYQAFSISLKDGSASLESLPNDQWFELGIRPRYTNWESSRLTRAYQSSTRDLISYKTFANAYDDNHFSHSDGFVYSGIAGSGTYLLAPITEASGSLSVPCLKAQVWIQTQRLSLGWKDSSLPCNSLNFQFGANIPSSHPWLKGYPYTLSNPKSILKIEAIGRLKAVDSLPAGLFLRYPMSYIPGQLVNFNLSASYPQWYRYQSVSAFEHNGFVMDGKTLQVSPAVPGYLFNAAQLTHSKSAYSLMMQSRMIWDERDYELHLDSDNPMPANTIMQINPQTAFLDRLNILASQYQLSLLSPCHKFSVSGNSSFYQNFQPLVRLRQSSRRANHLFSVSDGEFYRIYSYAQTDVLDGWHFSIGDGHISFILAHDGEFGVATDANPHISIEVIATNGSQPLIASLYQAQVDIPAQLIGAGMPLNGKVTLTQANDAPANSIGARRVVLRNPQGVVINPNFYNVPLEVPVPYIYVPVENYIPGMTLRMFYRSGRRHHRIYPGTKLFSGSCR